MKPSWRMHEERIAYHLGGRRTRGSGNGSRKGDVWIGKDWMLECKTTERDRYRLSMNTLDKLAQQSLQAGLSAALLIIFHRSYTDFDRYVLVLERRCEENNPPWRSVTLTRESLEQGITLVSRYGVWKSMSFEKFVESIRE